MESASLQSIILVEGRGSKVQDYLKQITDKIKQSTATNSRIFPRTEFLMMDFIVYSVDNIDWNLGIQLQEVIEELGTPVLFIGSNGSGLTDISQLKKGKFNNYLSSLLTKPDSLREFITYFSPYTKILDYCLNLWKGIIEFVEKMLILEELNLVIDYAPLKSLINERLAVLLNLEEIPIKKKDTERNDIEKPPNSDVETSKCVVQKIRPKLPSKNAKQAEINDNTREAEENTEKNIKKDVLKPSSSSDTDQNKVNIDFQLKSAVEVEEPDISRIKHQKRLNMKKQKKKRRRKQHKQRPNEQPSENQDTDKSEKAAKKQTEEEPSQQSLDDFF